MLTKAAFIWLKTFIWLKINKILIFVETVKHFISEIFDE